jgi:Protein of unknown function DUF262
VLESRFKLGVDLLVIASTLMDLCNSGPPPRSRVRGALRGTDIDETNMKKQDISVDSLCGMIRRGELRLPEIQRQYVWQAPRVRDLLDSLYRGYPSGSILVWETDLAVPARDLAVEQDGSSFSGQKLLLDGSISSGGLANAARRL